MNFNCYAIIEDQSISVLMLVLHFHLKPADKSTAKANSEIWCYNC